MSLEEICKFREVTSEDRENILEFANEHFIPYEPVNKAVNLCEEGYRMPYFDQYIEDCLDSPLVVALVAEHKESNDLLGVVITVIHTKDDDQAYSVKEDEVKALPRCRRPPTKLKKIFAFLEHLGHDIDIADRYGVDKWSDCVLVAGRVDQRVPGLGTELIKRSIDIATERENVKVHVGCATSYFSSRIFEKLGYSCIKSIKYQDYKVNDVIMFSPEPPHLEAKMLVKLV